MLVEFAKKNDFVIVDLPRRACAARGQVIALGQEYILIPAQRSIM